MHYLRAAYLGFLFALFFKTFYSIIYFCIYLCVWGGGAKSMSGEVRGQLWELVLSHHVDAGARIQVIMLSSKCLYVPTKSSHRPTTCSNLGQSLSLEPGAQRWATLTSQHTQGSFCLTSPMLGLLANATMPDSLSYICIHTHTYISS